MRDIVQWMDRADSSPQTKKKIVRHLQALLLPQQLSLEGASLTTRRTIATYSSHGTPLKILRLSARRPRQPRRKHRRPQRQRKPRRNPRLSGLQSGKPSTSANLQNKIPTTAAKTSLRRESASDERNKRLTLNTQRTSLAILVLAIAKLPLRRMLLFLTLRIPLQLLT